MKRLPNIITFIRLALIPFFVYLLINPSESQKFAAIVVFIFAALTDSIDGFLARKLKAISTLGKLLDPLADKLLVMSALVMLVSLRSDIDASPWVPAWMVVIILGRDVWVTGMRSVAAAKGDIIAAGNAGKVKSFLQMVAIVFLLLHDFVISIFFLKIPAQLIGLYLLLLSIMFSLWSAIDYTNRVLGTKGGDSEVGR